MGITNLKDVKQVLIPTKYYPGLVNTESNDLTRQDQSQTQYSHTHTFNLELEKGKTLKIQKG